MTPEEKAAFWAEWTPGDDVGEVKLTVKVGWEGAMDFWFAPEANHLFMTGGLNVEGPEVVEQIVELLRKKK